MSNSVTNVNNIKNGLCPHGMSPGACPICSGMGGGGSTRVGERPQKAGEMSYHQCAMIGAMMKARAQRIEAHEQNLKNHAEAIKSFENKIIQISAKLAEFVAKLPNNFIFKPIIFTLNNIVLPAINIIKNIPRLVQKFVDIQDKLNAIFGEAKAFIQKKISELVSNIKSKLQTFLKVFKRNKTKDEETKIDEDKKIFNLKNFIRKLWKKNDREDKQ